MTGPVTDSWFPACRADVSVAPVLDTGATRLFCLPHAGAGASAYRHWPSLLAPGVDVVPVQLPGRESRHREPLCHSVFDLTAGLLEPLADRAGENFALFGHSMGALLGYELAHALSAAGRPPGHLFVSGLGAPHLPLDRPLACRLPDRELLELIAELEGTTAETLAHPELLQLLLPVFRADFEICETYLHPDRPPLPVPVTALGGCSDPTVSVDRLGAWRNLTSASFHAAVFPGGHFYLHTQLDDVAGVVLNRLNSPAAAQRSATSQPARTKPARTKPAGVQPAAAPAGEPR